MKAKTVGTVSYCDKQTDTRRKLSINKLECTTDQELMDVAA